MSDAFVAGVLVSDAHVRAQFVGVKRFGFVLGDGLNESVDSLFLDVWDAAESHLSATLQSASNPNALGTLGQSHVLASVKPHATTRGQHRFIELNHAEK